MAEAPVNSSLGGYDDEFLNAIDEDWHCGICHLPMKEPILTKCGHKFCTQCLNGYFARLERDEQPLMCPVDRNNLLRDKDIFPDKAAERKILSFLIKCSSEGCQWTGELRSKDSHLASCPFKVVPCTNFFCEVRLPRKTLQEHVTNTCEWRILHCNHCDESTPACLNEAHQNECTRFPLTCPQICGAIVAREEVQRKEVESHLQSAIKSHLDLACVKLNNTEITLSNTQTQLSTTQIQLKITQEELKETKRKFEEKVNALENRLMEFPGVHTWKITGFSEIMRKAKSGEQTFINGAPFFYQGYKFRLSLLPNGDHFGENTHVSIFFHIMKGEFDPVLFWPFRKEVTFTLVDQQEDPNDRENITDSFTADDKECKEIFMRPVEEETPGYGFYTFVSHNRLNERRYIADDTMFVQVEVTPPKKKK